MTTIPQLMQGTQIVSPTSIDKYFASENKLETLKVFKYTGTNMEVVISTVRSSQKNKAYISQIAFYEQRKDGTPNPTGRVGVRCGCPMYYYYCSEANRRAGASYGARFKPYVRKTPTGTGYPEKNPRMIPMMCKHLMLLANTLQNSTFFTQSKVKSSVTA